MPLYTIQHHTRLTSAQCDALAAAITKTHTELFTVPSLFVNVHFYDINNAPRRYVGGKQELTNTIMGNVRGGPSRPRSAYTELCHRLEKDWNNCILNNSTNTNSKAKLDTVVIMDTIAAGYEQGFDLPEAGHDREWLKENMAEFERRAEAGDERMKGVVEEIKGRGLV